MLELMGYAAMGTLGVLLGLLGAGGSILAMPVLVYLFSVPAAQATGYSLLIVGTTALVGALQYVRSRQASPRVALVFGAPVVLGAYVTRRFIFPSIPNTLGEIGGATVTKDVVVMLAFSVFMLAASFSMIRGVRPGQPANETAAGGSRRLSLIPVLGLFVGMFTSFVGAGGGFMILPALILIAGLPVKMAIGTSLMVISANSLVGFLGEAQVSKTIDYGFLATVTVLPVAGIFLGVFLNKRVPAARLKTAFGWFVLVMGIYIAGLELAGI